MTTLAKALKNGKPITKISEDFNCSRPTLYKYINLYDEGKYDLIPQEIKAYFDTIVANDNSKIIYWSYHHNTIEEKESIMRRLENARANYKLLNDEIDSILEKLRDNPDNSTEEEYNKLCEQRNRCIKIIKEFEGRYAILDARINTGTFDVEQRAVKQGPWPKWIDGDVRHVCSGTEGNYIIIFENTDSEIDVYVELYTCIEGKNEYLGKYVPEHGKNFVQITGLPNTLDYSYRVVLLDDNGKHYGRHLRLSPRQTYL